MPAPPGISPAPWQATAGIGVTDMTSAVTVTKKESKTMSGKWIQDPLPIFGEPILAGDRVKIAQFIPGPGDKDEADASYYLGEYGTVVDISQMSSFPFGVEFEDGETYYYSANELVKSSE